MNLMRRLILTLPALFGCRRKPLSPDEQRLAEVRELVRKNRLHPGLPDSGRHIPEPRELGYNGSYTLVAGVWIEDGLYYKALGVRMGDPPLGADVRDRHPGIPDVIFGRCPRCDRSWKWVESHPTMYSKDGGYGPLCESCWNALTPKERLPYYRRGWESNREQFRLGGMPEEMARLDRDWPALERAVLEGK